jgi:hypothetical protein
MRGGNTPLFKLLKMIKTIFHIVSNDLSTNYSSDYTSEINFDIIIRHGDFDHDASKLLNIVKDVYVPKKGDKIYFLPGVSVPRVKFKNISLEYGIKTVRDPEQANVFFGSSKSIHQITNNAWLYKIKVEDFLAFIETVEHRLDTHTKDKINTALEFYDNEYIALHYNVFNNIISSVPDVVASRYTEKMYMIEDEHKALFDHLQKVTVYDESSVIDILNGEEATVIDKEMFEHIREMFKSSDTDNHVLAMEIMANSKYTESLVYLELLFYFYAGRISDIHTKNHVNFKSLVSYLDKNMRYLNTDIDNVVDSLVAKDQFTPDKLEIVMEYLSADIQSMGDTKYFTVKTITVHPDHIGTLNHNYTYQVQEDYIAPELPVESHVEETEVIITEEDKDLEEAFTRIERKELKSELIALEEENPVSESELNKTEEESNNNQITTNESTNIDWF